jgi:two-component system, cell cycle sensor histidine kinase and response regulator CckA
MAEAHANLGAVSDPERPALSPATLRLTLEVCPSALLAYDEASGRLIAANDVALALYGYDRMRFLSLALADLEADAADPPRPAIGVWHRRADGAGIAVQIACRPVAIEGNAAILATVTDVSAAERARLESERRCEVLGERELTLRENDARFRRLFETASDWYWETDDNGRLRHVSSNFETMFGVPFAAVKGKRLIELESVKIDPERGWATHRAIAAREPYRDLLYSRELSDGTKIWVRTSAVPNFDRNGRFAGYCGVCRDVTAQLAAEDTLRNREQQFRDVLEAAADYSWETDEQFVMSYMSPGFDKLHPKMPGSLVVGTRLTERPENSIDPEMGRMVLFAFRDRKPFRDFVFSRKTPDGKRQWLKTSGAPVFDRNGAFKGYRGVGAEITKHIEAEAASRLAQDRLHEAVAFASQPIVLYDAEDRIVAFNLAFADLQKMKKANTPVHQGASFIEVVDWQLRQGFYADGPEDPPVDRETLLARYQTEAEHTYHLRSGAWMMVVHRRLPGHGRVGLWTDITALKRAEADRRALEAQLHHSQRLEALGTLAGGAAHEINNALTPVLALTKIVARQLPVDSRQRRNLQTVLSSAERSRDLVKQILAFARKDEERPWENVDVSLVLQDALRLMRATVSTSIRFVEDILPTARINGDANQLRQVIVNVVANAAQAIGPKPGSITVSLQSEGSALRLSIADTGCGMDQATLDHLFEPFFTTKPVGEGTGLGLSVVHGIVAAHGGRIEVKSRLGEGSRFDIFLPPREVGAAAAL